MVNKCKAAAMKCKKAVAAACEAVIKRKEPVNKRIGKKLVVAKACERGDLPMATGKGGLTIVEALGSKARTWSDMARLLPARKDPSQGFSTDAVANSLVHGLLSGGRGFSATEPMRHDIPALKLIGMERAPSAETVEEVVKHLAATGGHGKLLDVLGNQAARLIGMEKRADMFNEAGFVPCWFDGTLIETEGSCRDALLFIKSKWGQMLCAAFVGPYAAACAMAQELEPKGAEPQKPEPKAPEAPAGDGAAKEPGAAGAKAPAARQKPEVEGELTVTRRLFPRLAAVLDRCSLRNSALLLGDSLYGDGPTLGELESKTFEGSRYIVGANKLKATEKVLAEQPEAAWIDTTKATACRDWEESAVCVCWLQCEGWESKRLLVGRRWKKKGEMIVNYSGVLTSLSEKDERVQAMMARERICFAQAVWRLYDGKQAMENHWKDLLRDMGLHRLPCGRAAVNEVFAAVAAVALNLATGVRRLALEGADRSMALWRLRLELIDLPAVVARHGRVAMARILDARTAFVDRLLRAMARLAAT